MDKRYDLFVTKDMSEYTGLWIAIVQDEIVAADKSAKTAYKKARDKYPTKSPLLAKVPTEETMIL